MSNLLSHVASTVTTLVNIGRAVRTDGWANLATGFGTSRDKTQAAYFAQPELLSPVDLANLYTYDDLAGTICDTYPREEMREGFGLSYNDSEDMTEVHEYLCRFQIPSVFTDARIWGNVFGGSVIWPVVEDGLDTAEPLNLEAIKTVTCLKVIDCRWLWPETYYTEGAHIGEPEVYRIVAPHAGGTAATIGLIHESRLIRFPGARTEHLAKIRLRMWDLSLLIKPYEALRQSGQTWQAIATLVADANQAVFSISELWEAMGADPTQEQDSETGLLTPSGKLLKRIAFMDRLRSAGRAIVLDKERETFERHNTTFTGLPELSDRAWKRLAAAADMPVTILMGEAPAGLSATGDNDIRYFFAKVSSNQKQLCEPRLRRLLDILMSAADAPKLEPKRSDAIEYEAKEEAEETELKIVWLPLWAPSATELADIRLKRAQEAQVWITQQGMLPEEGMMSLPKDWWNINRKLREDVLADAGKGEDKPDNGAKLVLTPSDIAVVANVNQALASVGLPPLKGEEGLMSVAEYKAMKEAAGAAAGEPEKPEPVVVANPGASPFPPGAGGKAPPPIPKAKATPLEKPEPTKE